MERSPIWETYHTIRSETVLDNPVRALLDNLVLESLFCHGAQPRHSDAQFERPAEPQDQVSSQRTGITVPVHTKRKDNARAHTILPDLPHQQLDEPRLMSLEQRRDVVQRLLARLPGRVPPPREGAFGRGDGVLELLVRCERGACEEMDQRSLILHDNVSLHAI